IWRFSPATVDERPVRARINYAIECSEPGAEGAPPPKPAPPIAAPTPTPAPYEVEVRGVRPDPAETSFDPNETREMPGTFGDPVRGVEALPGVTPVISGTPFYYVRGVPPGNIGYFLDGIRLPLLQHVALGPTIVHPALIERIDFYPAAAPARFGR